MTADRLTPPPIVHPEWYPYQHLVPRDRDANLRWRADMNRRCLTSEWARETIREMCSRDLLFFVNAFSWTHAPVLFPDAPEQPFVTWPAQDYLFSKVRACIRERKFLGIQKSRDQGASWVNLETFRWHMLFSPVMMHFKLVSRNEDMVYKPNEPDSLFWKVDFANERTPPWLIGKKPLERGDLSCFNGNNNSVINGTASTKDFVRGGRPNAIFADEFNAFDNSKAWKSLKAMQFATRCVIVNGTYDENSIGHAFEWVLKKSKWDKAEIWWQQNPFHMEGSYKDDSGKVRSAYYDDQCAKAASAGVIAGELDGDPYAASQPFYTAPLIDVLLPQCREPAMVGDLLFTPQGRTVFRERDEGHWKLWFIPDGDRPPINRPYSMGGDTGQGTGATPSCLAVYDATTGELMAEYRCDTIDPMDFGRLALAAHRWFGGDDDGACYTVIEANGPGRSVVRVFTEAGCGESEFHYRRKEDSDHDEPTMKPGWWASARTKFDLHDGYRTALKEGRIFTRSRWTVEELREFRHTKGTVVHSRAVNSMDPSASDENHGDMGTASALANLGIVYCEEVKPSDKFIPETSFLARRNAWQKTRKTKQRWSQRMRRSA